MRIIREADSITTQTDTSIRTLAHLFQDCISRIRTVPQTHVLLFNDRTLTSHHVTLNHHCHPKDQSAFEVVSTRERLSMRVAQG